MTRSKCCKVTDYVRSEIASRVIALLRIRVLHVKMD